MAKNERYSAKNEIVDAFVELMSQKEYLDITVTDIIKEANVARMSFYRNFNSISDVVNYIIDDLSEEFTEDVFPILVSNDERRLRAFLFEYFYRLTQNQKRMANINLQNVVFMFSRLNEKLQMREREFPSNTLRDKYTPFAKLGLINNISTKWIDTGMKETPEEMIDYIMSFITLF